MSLVVDSSIAASWGLPDEDSAAAKRALSMLRETAGLVPSLFQFELINVFLMGERRQRLTPQQTALGLAFVSSLELQIVDDGLSLEIAQVARRHGLTAYDATYLELAIRTGSILATSDGPLARAAVAEGLEVISDRI